MNHLTTTFFILGGGLSYFFDRNLLSVMSCTLKSNDFSDFLDFFAFPNILYLLDTFVFCRKKPRNEHDDVRISKIKIGMTAEVR